MTGAAKTLLIPLYIRALESQPPDALINDGKAVQLVSQIDYDFDHIKLLHLNESNKLVIILRSREFDHYALDYLRRHPNVVVVHIGCEIERWGGGIHLLDEWGFFDCPEPRLDGIRWMRWIESLARTLRIYHFQLGEQTV
jgi:hypothetical protein